MTLKEAGQIYVDLVHEHATRIAYRITKEEL
jgi:hypothetical protein